MLVPASNSNTVSVLGVEGALTAIAFALSFCLPGFGESFFRPIERGFARLARRKRLSVVLVGAVALLLRLAILPIHPIPHPYYTDDFGFLFAADTFAHGRLANPTPALWTHFETMHISMTPTYGSMFFPAYGLALAAGQVLFGQPWFAQLCVMALMCAAICWMLQAWLPPSWALLGGLLAILRLGLFSYWMDTYVGGGLLAALAGAMVLGALPRFRKKVRVRDALILTAGVLILANSRPFEGMLLCLPVALALGFWMLRGENRPTGRVMLRAAALPMVLIVAAGAWMAYYNYRNFGNPLTLPYTLNRATYAVAPHFLWESPSPVPTYRHQAIHDYYMKVELPEFQKIHSASGFLPQTLLKGLRTFLFFSEFALLPPLILLRRIVLDRRTRFLMLCMIPLVVGLTAEATIRPYYLAPFTAVFYALGLQMMRHLKQWKPGGQAAGSTIQRAMIAICVAMAALELCARPAHLGLPSSPGAGWACECLDSPQSGAERAEILKNLEQLPGKQLVLVRYTANHDASEEWVYNSPDLESAKVVWAREMNSAGDPNAELLRYYRDRSVWLVEPDATPAKLSPYPAFNPDVSLAASSREANRSNFNRGVEPGSTSAHP